MRDELMLQSSMTDAAAAWDKAHPVKYITIEQYFGGKEHTPEQEAEAVALLALVNALLNEYVTQGGVMTIDTDTGTYISGAKGGSGDGGFRLPDSTTGAPKSKHRSAQAVDVSDQDNKLDEWITRDILIKYQLWREAAPFTMSWCHLQSVAPKSGNRSFIP